MLDIGDFSLIKQNQEPAVKPESITHPVSKKIRIARFANSTSQVHKLSILKNQTNQLEEKKKSKPNNYWYKYKPKHIKHRKANCTRGITKIFILIRSNELEEKRTLLTSETEMIPSPCGPNPSSIFPDKSSSLSYSS